jgi:hypothetical protein
MSSLYQLKKNTNISIDKICVVEQILDYVYYILKAEENKQLFDEGKDVFLEGMWDSSDTSKPSVLFPENFWNNMRTKIRPTTFITGSYNRFKKRHETYWLNGSAFNMCQFELSKEGIRLTNKSENNKVVWVVNKCDKVVYNRPRPRPHMMTKMTDRKKPNTKVTVNNKSADESKGEVN